MVSCGGMHIRLSNIQQKGSKNLYHACDDKHSSTASEPGTSSTVPLEHDAPMVETIQPLFSPQPLLRPRDYFGRTRTRGGIFAGKLKSAENWHNRKES